MRDISKTALSGLILAGAILLGPRAEADGREAMAAICEASVARAAAGSSVPQSVLHAISLTETGQLIGGRLRPWPWAINREGKSYWFQTREEALAFARASLAEGRRSFDVGCFQINYHWHGDAFPSVESMFEPDVSGAYAARFLTDLHTELGNWSAAAGAYHSRTPEFATIYRTRFDRILAGLATGQPLVADAAPEAEDAQPRKSRERLTARPLIIAVSSRRQERPKQAPTTPRPPVDEEGLHFEGFAPPTPSVL